MLRFDIPPVFSHVVRWEAFIVFSLCLLALLVSPWFLLVLPLQGMVKGFIGHHKCSSHQLWKKLFVAMGWQGKARQGRKCRRKNVCGQAAVYRQHGCAELVCVRQASVEGSGIGIAALFVSRMGVCLLRSLLGLQRLVSLLSAQRRLKTLRVQHAQGPHGSCIRYTSPRALLAIDCCRQPATAIDVEPTSPQRSALVTTTGKCAA